MRSKKAAGIDNFHHKRDNNNMNVVEKDVVVSGMLQDELSRCKEAHASIRKALSGLPKGSLSVRKRLHKDREYRYHYLKFREGDKVVNQYVAQSKLRELRNKLDQRKKYEKEAKVYEKRISYLQKLLKAKGRRSGV
ncbi:MAG TPA: hypothetical protein VMT62_07295 [Syntrophorhabdaceae bacterium]|nr:hypothetical protein [Syntrophorhabdaceae bacterium]